MINVAQPTDFLIALSSCAVETLVFDRNLRCLPAPASPADPPRPVRPPGALDLLRTRDLWHARSVAPFGFLVARSPAHARSVAHARLPWLARSVAHAQLPWRAQTCWARAICCARSASMARSICWARSASLARSIYLRTCDLLRTFASLARSICCARSASLARSSLCARAICCARSLPGTLDLLQTFGLLGALDLQTFGFSGSLDLLQTFGLLCALDLLQTFGFSGSLDLLQTIGLLGALDCCRRSLLWLARSAGHAQLPWLARSPVHARSAGHARFPACRSRCLHRFFHPDRRLGTSLPFPGAGGILTGVMGYVLKFSPGWKPMISFSETTLEGKPPGKDSCSGRATTSTCSSSVMSRFSEFSIDRRLHPLRGGHPDPV